MVEKKVREKLQASGTKMPMVTESESAMVTMMMYQVLKICQ